MKPMDIFRLIALQNLDILWYIKIRETNLTYLITDTWSNMLPFYEQIDTQINFCVYESKFGKNSLCCVYAIMKLGRSVDSM